MYRYNTFHDDLMLELINTVHKGISHQAYIFEGPEGLNVLESARLFAASLTCKNKESAPCGDCEICKLSYGDTNPDIVYITTGDKKSIGVDAVREMAKDVYIKPFSAEKKVYIIDDGMSLTDEAQNAMLKILEEPPEYAVFIIITTSSAGLLPTVCSRCTKVRFTPLSEERMRQYIEENFEDPGLSIDFLVKFSQGIPQNAEDIINDADFEPLRQEAFRMLIPLLSKHKISAYQVSEFLENNKDRADMILEIWESFLRDIMFISNDAKEMVVNSDLKNEMTKIAGRLPDKYVIIALECVIRGKYMLKRYVNLHALGLNLSFSIKKAQERL